MPEFDEVGIKRTTVWAHMVQLVAQLATERPKKAVDTIESISNYVETGRSVPPAKDNIYADTRPKIGRVVKASATQDVTWAENFGNYLVPPKPQRRPQDDEEEEEPEEEIPDQGELADCVAEQAVFAEFGEGLIESEAFRVSVGMKRLLDKEPLAKARFWGKITGRHRDYYISETRIDEARVEEAEDEGMGEDDEEDEDGLPADTIYKAMNKSYMVQAAPPVPAEEEGHGLNEFRYYVATSDDLTKWYALPNVQPRHIQAARTTRNAFSGDLEAPVACHPPFPGVEKHYLRAQIARIHCTCSVAPRDMYTTEGAVEEEEEDENGNPIPRPFEVHAYEEVPPLNTQDVPDAEDAEMVAPVQEWFHGYKDDELLQGKNWVHVTPTLLQQGRVTFAKPEDENPPAPDEEEEELQVDDEGVDADLHTELINPFLSDLGHDATMSFEGHSRAAFSSWSFRKAFTNPSSTKRLYLARSMRWPGAMTYAVCEDGVPGAKVQTVYISNGLKSLQGQIFAPALPPLRCTEFPGELKLQRDGTVDDELEFAPMPPAPVRDDEEEEEEDM